MTDESELKVYLDKHHIHDLFTKIVEELLQSRPEHPLQAIADYLQAEHGVVAKRESPRDQPEEVVEESDSSDDSGDDDDYDDVSDLKSIPASTAAPPSRRISVSAGVLDFNAVHHAPEFEKTPQEIEEINKCLSSNALFKGIESSSKKTLVKAMEKCTYGPGEDIIKQGDMVAEHFFLLSDGTAEALIGETSVKTYGEAEGFGELALLYNKPRAATVRSTSDLTVWRLDQKTFKNIIVVGVIKKRERFINFLKQCSLMKELNELELMTLADSLESHEHVQGQEIIKQGDVGNDFFLVESGSVKCIKDGVEVGEVGPGSYFGEISLLYDKPRQATVIVNSPDATILAIDRKTFQRLMGPLGDILRRNPLHHGLF